MIIHDGVRPFIDEATIFCVAQAAMQHGVRLSLCSRHMGMGQTIISQCQLLLYPLSSFFTKI